MRLARDLSNLSFPDRLPHSTFEAFADHACRWRDQKNVFRTTWNVNNVPALVRYEHVDGVTKEVGRLVEGEILDEGRLARLVDA